MAVCEAVNFIIKFFIFKKLMTTNWQLITSCGDNCVTVRLSVSQFELEFKAQVSAARWSRAQTCHTQLCDVGWHFYCYCLARRQPFLTIEAPMPNKHRKQKTANMPTFPTSNERRRKRSKLSVPTSINFTLLIKVEVKKIWSDFNKSTEK